METGLSTFGGADLIFVQDVHEYRLPLDGRVVPNVTSILRATGMSTDFEELKASSSRLGERIEYRRALGTAVHADAHAFDDDDLDWDSVSPDVLPYLRAWAEFRAAKQLTPVARERRVFHHGQFYCGTLDGIFEDSTRRRILVDIKIGDPDDAAADLQTAGYEAAHLAEHPDDTIDARWSVQLVPEMRVPYRVTDYSARPNAWQHGLTFQACVAVYHQQQLRRKGRR